MVILKIQQNAYMSNMSNPTLVLTENNSYLQKVMGESRHPDFERFYEAELNKNLGIILQELYPKLKP